MTFYKVINLFEQAGLDIREAYWGLGKHDGARELKIEWPNHDNTEVITFDVESVRIDEATGNIIVRVT